MPSKRDRHAFIACSALAIAIILAVWIWTVRITVSQGVAGAREVFSDVAATAGDVREEARPDEEAVTAVKAGFEGMIEARKAEEEERDAAVNAVAEIIAGELRGTEESDGTEGPKETDEPHAPEDAEVPVFP
jgi:hypothetical protein